ncbi:LuxR C-terminal-related transcriptional regulator [Embleya sp. NBC_00896]|uniref:helix-turn-helix transcriptional regulator n=1 Tax=Embleya sp. NBC_00896 TaxID=2975961 RepID=UPI002F908B1E|nr:LuxR C-terminal-related transcriptional regulator [Embleya sp. NBC_00896]
MDRHAVAAAVGMGLAVNRPGGADWELAFDALTSAVPRACAVQVNGWDPVTGGFVVPAERGYSRAVSADLVAMPRTMWGRQLLASPRPLLIDDRGLGFRTSPHFRDWLNPAGFEDGLGTCLRSDEGRAVGFIQMSATRRAAFGEPARAFVAEVARILAPHVDPYRYPQLDASFDADWTGNRLTADGRSVPLSGRADSPLSRDETIAALAHAFAALRKRTLAFLWSDGRDWHQVVLVCTDHCNRAGVLLMTRPYANDSGLTLREVDVLTGIAGGLANPVIAAQLMIGRRTVETYVERLLAKLGCASRSELAALAARNGLLRPAPEPGRLGDVAVLTRDPLSRPLIRA